jgi:uncharacterized SAM-binding protein YcdF (DUF218 family)
MPINRISLLDFNGLVTLTLSIFVTILGMGTTYFLTLIHVFKVASKSSHLCGATDLVIVHGIKLTRNKIGRDFTVRLDRALSLHQQNQAYILLLGGILGDNNISEAEAGRQYLIEQGIDLKYVMIEDHSRHTLENLYEARKLIGNLEVKCCSLLSNRYHLARISAFARGMNMDITLVAAEKEFKVGLSKLGRFLTEAFYLHWYYTGKYWGLATNSADIKNKIN